MVRQIIYVDSGCQFAVAFVIEFQHVARSYTFSYRMIAVMITWLQQAVEYARQVAVKKPDRPHLAAR